MNVENILNNPAFKHGLTEEEAGCGGLHHDPRPSNALNTCPNNK